MNTTLSNWVGCPRPSRTPLQGRFCRLEPLNVSAHAAHLYRSDSLDADGKSWTYLSYGPFPTLDAYVDWMERTCLGDDPLFFAILDLSGRPVGVAAYLRIDPLNGSIEVGHLHFSPLLQRTPAATEAMALMMRKAFDMGYRRYEWKCNSHNQASRRAAERLGFTYEGTFRQTGVVKGQNRDTAWLSIIDGEWPARRRALEAWLHPDNFTPGGEQRRSLQSYHNDILSRFRLRG